MTTVVIVGRLARRVLSLGRTAYSFPEYRYRSPLIITFGEICVVSLLANLYVSVVRSQTLRGKRRGTVRRQTNRRRIITCWNLSRTA